MNIFERIIKIGQAEAHAVIGQLEDPIKLSEQAIRDLQAELEKSLAALAKVKALAIRARNDAAQHQEKACSYENKAVQLLQRAHKGSISPAEADRLAGEALYLKEDNLKLAAQAQAEQAKFEQSVTHLDGTVKNQRAAISKWENELKTLKSRVTVSNATKTINKQLSRIDASGTVSLLERMKEKLAVEEALAESYGEMANNCPSIDQQLDQALQCSDHKQAADEVAALKAKLGLSETAIEES